jgi:hypothetical protein
MPFLRSPSSADSSFETLARQLGQGLPRRRALALLAATLASGGLAPRVDAARKILSIAKRVQAQRELCEIGGGTLDVKNTAFGSTITTCNGGEGDGYTCVNTAKSTKCHQAFTAPPDNVYTPPTGGVYDPPTGGGGGTWTTPGGGTWTTTPVARAGKRHGPGKKRRAGGKRKK